MLSFGEAASPQLARLALEAVARVIGPVATYLPGSPGEWRELERRVAAHLHPMGSTSVTAGQVDCERRLLEHEPALPAVGLYFGLSENAHISPDEREPALLRLPQSGEEGEPFDVVLRRRVGGEPAAYRDLVAYLQGYSHILDEWGRSPTTHEFADHWRFDPSSVRRDETLFAHAFPEEPSPERLLRMLNRGLPTSSALGWQLAVRVIDAAPREQQAVIPAAGQRWRKPDGSREMTLIETGGDQIVAGLHDGRAATTSLWVGTRAELAGWELVVPESVWRVRFDVDVNPATLIGPLDRAGIVADRLARPGDPRPGQVALAAGTVEAHVVAPEIDTARHRVANALRGHANVSASDVRVERLPSHAKPMR
jgi:hypothetical protein